jgi:O-antigen/teichoic acid export membrane protein
MLLLVTMAAGLNVVLNLIFIPRYGYNGAAAATFLSYLVYPLLVYRVSRAEIPWRLQWRSAGRTVAAVLVMAAVMLGLKGVLAGVVHPLIEILVAALLGLAVYAGCLLLLKEIRPYEKKLLTRHK